MTDAREKCVLISKYLAFYQEGKVNEDDRHHILHRIFMKSSDGLISDDFTAILSQVQQAVSTAKN